MGKINVISSVPPLYTFQAKDTEEVLTFLDESSFEHYLLTQTGVAKVRYACGHSTVVPMRRAYEAAICEHAKDAAQVSALVANACAQGDHSGKTMVDLEPLWTTDADGNPTLTGFTPVYLEDQSE